MSAMCSPSQTPLEPARHTSPKLKLAINKDNTTQHISFSLLIYCCANYLKIINLILVINIPNYT